MAQTPEGKVKARIKKALHQHDCWYYMPVPGGYGAPTLDFLCASSKGRAFAIEAKAPSGRLTSRQRLTIETMAEKNVPTFVCDGNIEELVAWILLLE